VASMQLSARPATHQELAVMQLPPVLVEALSGTVGAMTALTLTYPLMAVRSPVSPSPRRPRVGVAREPSERLGLRDTTMSKLFRTTVRPVLRAPGASGGSPHTSPRLAALTRTTGGGGLQVNTRQQTTQRQAGSTGVSGWNTAKTMIREDGSLALFRGWGPAMFGTGVSQVRTIPGPSLITKIYPQAFEPDTSPAHAVTLLSACGECGVAFSLCTFTSTRSSGTRSCRLACKGARELLPAHLSGL
jgi:hypothetical protein